MSNFECEWCGSICYDTEHGYITGCSHYPPDLKICKCGHHWEQHVLLEQPRSHIPMHKCTKCDCYNFDGAKR